MALSGMLWRIIRKNMKTLTTKEVLARNEGWTEHFIRKFLPVHHSKRYCYRRRRGIRYHYAVADIERCLPLLKQDLERKARLAARPKGTSAEEKRQATFAKKFSTWREALPEGCALLFDLNRYAKHHSCTRGHKDEIYALKTDLIKLLYQGGYSVECYLHTTKGLPRICFGCDGLGYRYNGHECQRCEGTGTYAEARTLEFVVFQFLVGDQHYFWHSPRSHVTFPYRVTREESTNELTAEEKPITLKPAEFAGGKSLLRWIVAKKNSPSLLDRLLSA